MWIVKFVFSLYHFYIKLLLGESYIILYISSIIFMSFLRLCSRRLYHFLYILYYYLDFENVNKAIRHISSHTQVISEIYKNEMAGRRNDLWSMTNLEEVRNWVFFSKWFAVLFCKVNTYTSYHIIIKKTALGHVKRNLAYFVLKLKILYSIEIAMCSPWTVDTIKMTENQWKPFLRRTW